jgi:hypothetical protein
MLWAATHVVTSRVLYRLSISLRRLKCGDLHICHFIDGWRLKVIGSFLISGCVRNNYGSLINVACVWGQAKGAVKMGLAYFTNGISPKKW